MDEEIRAGLREFIDYLRDLFERKRRVPTDDMISRLVHADEDGDVLDEEEVLATVFLKFLAGHVTTVNLVGNGVVALLTHPEQLAKLKADPGLAKGVVEETLRYWGPVGFIGRRAAREDVEVGGTVIPTGEQATFSLASANRDPERFADPDVFDITRADANRHVAFGKGIHICLGAPLARLEGQVAFDTLFRRYPDLRLAVPAEEMRWGRGASYADSRACQSGSRSYSEDYRLVRPHKLFSSCTLACGLRKGIAAKVREEAQCKATLQLVWQMS